MKAVGRKMTWSRKNNDHVTEKFEFDVPAGCTTQFDASQSTVILKDRHGNTLVALKSIHEFWLESNEVTWSVEGSQTEAFDQLKAEAQRLSSELAFYKEMKHGSA